MLFLSGRHNFAPGEYIAVTNGGSVRAGLKAGPVLEKALDAVLPFGNEVRFGLINGTTIRLMLERSVWDIPGGPFLSVQGLRFWYDPVGAQGSRVQRVEVCSRSCMTARRPVTPHMNRAKAKREHQPHHPGARRTLWVQNQTATPVTMPQI
jgi:hypothetical protein